jgi:hypothetical protein
MRSKAMARSSTPPPLTAVPWTNASSIWVKGATTR